MALIHSYLSCLAWEQNRAIPIVAHEFNSVPFACIQPRSMGGSWEQGMETELSPNERQELALASFRQGISADLPIESVFHFFRVLELATGRQNKDLVPWFQHALQNLRSFEAMGSLEAMQQRYLGLDLPKFLINRLRHPVIHAKTPPIMNPDDARAAEQVSEALPLLRGLASDAIARDLGLQSGEPASGS